MKDNAPVMIQSAVDQALPAVVAARHHLHQNPELSHHEKNTAAFVAEQLRAIGMDDIRTDVGGHGIVATLKGGQGSGKTLALRADMDALPIQEENLAPYRSCVPGVMHACGHDGHTATLLGAAAALKSLQHQLKGEVRFLFQPAEEVAEGARAMCKEGAMEGIDAIFALHGWPGLPAGSIGCRPGPMMASADTFDIAVLGRNAHAAMPHKSLDPIVCAAHIITALQTLVSRETNPIDSVVVSVTRLDAGTAYNIIPAKAELKGTVRCLIPEIRQAMPEKMERVTAGICSALDAKYEFHYRFGTPVTINDHAMTEMVTQVGREVLGEHNVIALEAPSLGAEDFAVYLGHAPGAMFRLGVGEEKPPLHTPGYDFGDEPLQSGMRMFTRLAMHFLAQT